MGYGFTKNAKTGGTDAIVIVQRQIIQVPGREHVLVFNVRNRNSLDKDLRWPNLHGMASSPTRTRPTRFEQREHLGVVHLGDARTELEVPDSSQLDRVLRHGPLHRYQKTGRLFKELRPVLAIDLAVSLWIG